MAETNPLEIIRQQKQNCDTALEAARTEKECLEETKKAVFEAAKTHAQAYISEEEEKRFLSNIRQTRCAPPTSAQLTPVLKESFKEVGPEITYKRVINGKKWFWLGVFLLLASLYVFGENIYQNHTGTKEAWANRNYIAAVELEDKNPGEQYHKIIELFDMDHMEEARKIVLNNEVLAKEHGKTKRQLEKKLRYYLSNEEYFNEGITVLSWEKNSINGKPNTFVVFQDVKRQGVFKAWIDASDFIFVTMSEKVTSLKSAQKYADCKIWRLCGELNTPYERTKEE